MDNKTTPKTKAPTLTPRESLHTQLLTDLQAQPVEAGFQHRAEQTLQQALQQNEDAQEWVADILADTERPAVGESILRCLASLREPGDADWRLRIVEEALQSPNAGVRDAAIQAVEIWQEPLLAKVLRHHHDPVRWLDEYAKGVVRDVENLGHHNAGETP